MARRLIKVFISYRKREPSKSIAAALAEKLKNEYGFEVFIDVIELMSGFEWAKEIYRNIRESDVLVVLLQPETAESEWVQREVDVARGANVSILPAVVVNPDEINVKEIQERLAIEAAQFFKLNPDAPDYALLNEHIEVLAKETRKNQKAWINERSAKWNTRNMAACNKDYAIFTCNGHPCQIHIATGDVIEMDGIEVVVNSENNFMQMARIYESATLSSALRREGSLMSGAGFVDDTVQRELDDQIRMNNRYRIRPVKMGEVLVTRAGMPDSNLAQRGMRYILHAATVRVDPDFSEKMTPLNTDDGIRKVTMKCLKTIGEINHARGVVAPEGTDAYLNQIQDKDTYQELRTIYLPLFGNGNNGRSALEITPPMIEAIRQYLHDSPNTSLEHIYIGVYAHANIPLVESKFIEAGFTLLTPSGK